MNDVFHAEDRLWHAESTESRTTLGVGVPDVAIDIEMWDPVTSLQIKKDDIKYLESEIYRLIYLSYRNR
jgi:hypothetical protein